MPNKVYQFKVSLKGIKPSIWRRIQVPETYTFWDLHVAIQDSMGWTDSHLHQFEILNPQCGTPEFIGNSEYEYDEDVVVLSEEIICISSYFSLHNKSAIYVYDYGDNWIHHVVLEEILPQKPGLKYPICIDGERACPPEDCGGCWGYEELVEIMKSPKHERYAELRDWLGKKYKPEEFKSEKVLFDDTEKRFEESGYF